MNLNFTLRQLEYAVAVERHLNFREAAEACFVSQPSLSTQLSQLENALGKKLFERGTRGVAVTPFGAMFVAGAREILERSAGLVDLASAQKPPLSSEIRIGVIPTVAPFVLPRALPLLAERHPDARVYLVEKHTRDLVELLLDGRLDVLLLALEAELKRCETMALFDDRFLLALNESHPLNRPEKVGLDDLPLDQLLLLEEGHCLSQQVAETCKFTSHEHDFRASSLTTLVQMVSLGIGITLLPEIAAGTELVAAHGLTLRQLNTDAHRTIGLAWRPGTPRREEYETLGRLIVETTPTAA